MINRELDQFFTTEETAIRCLNYVSLSLDIKNISWIEPSAGAGSFLKVAKIVGFPSCVAAYDLMPQHDGVIKADFLTVNLETIFKENSVRCCIGNPPFGKNSSLAIKFFNHAAKNVDVIAMIFPSTFCKESVIKKLNKNFHLIGELDLGSIEFLFINESRKVPVVFQVWKRNDELRLDFNSKRISEYFSFVDKINANFAIQRVGFSAGKVKHDLSNLASASHYFIKGDKSVIDTFNLIDWSNIKNKTAGNPSIAKTELIREFESKLNNK